MAEAARTVRVTGLPTDTDDNRLRDKLLIHFLRARNGGGEIESLTIVKATPVFALITFEDSRVAQRVIQHSQHILEVDTKKYNITVTEHHECLDPDKVILSLSAVVDIRQLPGGVMALTGLHKRHPDIQINCDDTVELYTLHGAYSNVQAALAQLLDPGGPESADDSDENPPSGSRSVRAANRPLPKVSGDQRRKPDKQIEPKQKDLTARPSDLYSSDTHRDLISHGSGWKDICQTEGAALQLPGHPTTAEEDFLLIVDADMFQYLQKHCRTKYERILRQYGVDVVDMTNQGLTTLFLQVATGVGEESCDQESLKLARMAISSLFQENQTKICRAQLPKSILSPSGDLQRAKENLSVRLPKLLLNEDDRYIYIIGNNSDVSEAKQFLLDHSEERGNKDDVANLLRYPLYDSGALTHADEQRVPPTTSSSVDFVDDSLDQLLKSEEERRAEGARRYKLAARFKDSGLATLGSLPTDFSIRGGLSSPSRQTRPGPMLGYDILSDTAEIAGEGVSRALSQNTGGDILFRSGDALPTTNSMQSKTPLNSNLIDTQPKSLTSPLGPNSSTLSQSAQLPPAQSGSSLRRTSSFSGTPQQKAQVMGQKSQDDSGKPVVRAKARSNSLSNQTGQDKQRVYIAEFTVPIVMWQYLKEAYSYRVDDLTAEVQMKESRSMGSRDLTVTLKGANSSEVSSCQLGLQKLVDSVSIDFSVLELHLSELGITDATDENLQACCAEVRSQFKKVIIRILKKCIYFLGPKELCSKVCASLREVFSGDLAQISEQQDFSTPSTSNWNSSTLSETNENQKTSLHGNPQVVQDSQSRKADGNSGSQGKRNHRSDFQETEFVNGSVSQLFVRKDPVIKEKVKVVSTVHMEGQKTETFVNDSKTGNDKSSKHVNGDVGTARAHTDKDMALHTKEGTMHSTQKDSIQQSQAEIKDTPEESTLVGLGGLRGICVCGEKEITRTKCGSLFCSKCLATVHVHCQVCPETMAMPRGIQGKMNYSKLHISVPGHKKDSAIKITYCIPDGIQKEGHPSPGKPFQGAVFEAYLPECEKTTKLLPRLEKAFRQGLTFTVVEKDTGSRVAWDCIPHKTSIYGGKSGNGYPDSTYLTRLSDVLASHGIKEPPAKS